jgi:hypothetical protein
LQSALKELEVVRAYESEVGPVVLDPSSGKETPALYFRIHHPHTVSPRYADIHARKAALIIRMLEIRIGRELLLQVLCLLAFKTDCTYSSVAKVLNKILALATQVAQQKFYLGTWQNMLLSTPSVSLSLLNHFPILIFRVVFSAPKSDFNCNWERYSTIYSRMGVSFPPLFTELDLLHFYYYSSATILTFAVFA